MSLIKLATSKEKMLNAVQWMGGSLDFSPGGKARTGYMKIIHPILVGKQAGEISPIVENQNDPRFLPLTQRQTPQQRIKPNKTVLNWGMKE